jgi:hypothetical protein
MDNHHDGGVEVRWEVATEVLQSFYSAGGSSDYDQVSIWHWFTFDFVRCGTWVPGFPYFAYL